MLYTYFIGDKENYLIYFWQVGLRTVYDARYRYDIPGHEPKSKCSSLSLSASLPSLFTLSIISISISSYLAI